MVSPCILSSRTDAVGLCTHCQLAALFHTIRILVCDTWCLDRHREHYTNFCWKTRNKYRRQISLFSCMWDRDRQASQYPMNLISHLQTSFQRRFTWSESHTSDQFSTRQTALHRSFSHSCRAMGRSLSSHDPLSLPFTERHTTSRICAARCRLRQRDVKHGVHTLVSHREHSMPPHFSTTSGNERPASSHNALSTLCVALFTLTMQWAFRNCGPMFGFKCEYCCWCCRCRCCSAAQAQASTLTGI